MLRGETINGLGRQWLWPVADAKCRKVIFDWAADVGRVLSHTERRELVVQAGGNMGVWPYLLAKQFSRVITFEADPLMAPFLEANVQGLANVDVRRQALFSQPGRCVMGCELHEVNNLGAQFIKPQDAGTEMVTIDSLFLAACDLIYLDIEGAELDALKGGRETIAMFKPLIAVEDKGLSARFGTAQGAIQKWLEQFGYTPVARYHRDTVFKAR